MKRTISQKAASKPAAKSTTTNSPHRFCFVPCWPGMQNILNFVRFCVYLAIISWAAIVLGLACNFEKMLVASDLTRFVPLAIFIAATTMLAMFALLFAPIALRHNPISTMYELVSLAFLGIFWLALGVYTATAEMGDVECYADDAETEVIDYAAFTTDIYHAQYRALEGFALINVFMLFGFLFFMLLQAYVQHRKGYKTVWSTPLPMYPWFGRRRGGRSGSKLPPPVTAKEPKGHAPMVAKAGTGPVAAKAAAPAPAPKPAPPPKAAPAAAPKPPPAAAKPAVTRSKSIPAPNPAAATAPARAAPVRTQTLPAGASASRPKATPAAATASKPTPYTAAAQTKPKAYASQYTKPSTGVPQTKPAGQSSGAYLYHVPPKQPAPAPAQPAAKAASRPAAATRR